MHNLLGGSSPAEADTQHLSGQYNLWISKWRSTYLPNITFYLHNKEKGYHGNKSF